MPHPVRPCLSLAVATALICSGSLLVSVNAYAADNNEIRDFTRQALFIPDASVSFRQIDDDWDDNQRYRGRYGDSDDLSDDLEDDEPWDDD